MGSMAFILCKKTSSLKGSYNILDKGSATPVKCGKDGTTCP